EPVMKVVWIGDLNQLPPVGDMQTLRPSGRFHYKLTKIHRQAADNPLIEPLAQLVSFIEGADPVALKTSEKFVRGVPDLADAYLKDQERDKVLLAYTNQRVEFLNQAVQGYDEPKGDEELFSPSTQKFYRFHDVRPAELITEIDRPYGEALGLN